MSDVTSPEKSPWGWKSLIISAILSCFFLGFFYLAVTNEPDYMPSQNKPAHNMHHSTGANATSSASGPTAAEMGMTEEEHANMSAEQMGMTQEEHANMTSEQSKK
jgi:hypothetical protein